MNKQWMRVDNGTVRENWEMYFHHYGDHSYLIVMLRASYSDMFTWRFNVYFPLKFYNVLPKFCTKSNTSRALFFMNVIYQYMLPKCNLLWDWECICVEGFSEKCILTCKLNGWHWVVLMSWLMMCDLPGHWSSLKWTTVTMLTCIRQTEGKIWS